MPGVLKIVRDGSFLGVICEREEQAINTLGQLRKSATWEGELVLPNQELLFEHMLYQDSQSYLVLDGTPVESNIPPVETPTEAAHTLSSTYYRPFQMHASLGPSASVAQMTDGKLTLSDFEIKQTETGKPVQITCPHGQQVVLKTGNKRKVL